jgi:hypothetical protein
MRVWMIAAMAGAALAASHSAVAADNEAGAPLVPADAAGPWTLESSGHAICVVTLGSQKAGAAGYAVKAPAACGGALPPNMAAWAPEGDGMKFVSADGERLMGFGRWSNSLFVAHRASGEDVQLKRGGPST